MGDYEMFADRLGKLVDEEHLDHSGELAERYWRDDYTGRFFHVLSDDTHPNEITARDITAVSMLGVTIPAAVAVWLLSDEGIAEVRELLTPVPTDVDIWDAGPIMEEGGGLWMLWEMLQSASWPAPTPGNDMGSTKISKLLATKRPRLVPIWDSRVRELLPSVPNHWAAFQGALADDHLRLLLSVAANRGAPEGPAFLRKLDAMLWMLANEMRHVPGSSERS